MSAISSPGDRDHSPEVLEGDLPRQRVQHEDRREGGPDPLRDPLEYLTSRGNGVKPGAGVGQERRCSSVKNKFKKVFVAQSVS